RFAHLFHHPARAVRKTGLAGRAVAAQAARFAHPAGADFTVATVHGGAGVAKLPAIPHAVAFEEELLVAAHVVAAAQARQPITSDVWVDVVVAEDLVASDQTGEGKEEGESQERLQPPPHAEWWLAPVSGQMPVCW